MKNGFRQSMAWLHTWSGLLLGWLLFMIFLAGTASYFREEISRYTRPEVRAVALDVPVAAEAAGRYLSGHATEAGRWFITPPTPRNPGELSVFWRDSAGEPHSHLVDVQSAERHRARDTRGGDFFYRLHFDLHYISARTARWIVGFAAMMMFVAIVSGVVTHKKIFKDFFTFRPNRGQRSWLDAHNFLAVLSLPYHAVITYTGLITLMFMYMPWGISSQYGDDQGAFFDQAFPRAAAPELSGDSAGPAPLGDIVREAQRLWNGGAVGFITVHNPGAREVRVNVREGADRSVAYNTASLEFDGQGRLLESLSSTSGAAVARNVLYGLHLARFADIGLRWLLFLVGLTGTAMIATGLVLWSVKRQPAGGARMALGERLVSGLNVGVVAGLPLAMAGFFWANRLLPLDLAHRAQWEIHCFFLVWLAALVYGLVRRDRRGWKEQLAACAAAFGALPVINALATDRGLAASLADADGVFVAFDLAFLVFASLFAAAALRLRRAPSAPQHYVDLKQARA